MYVLFFINFAILTELELHVAFSAGGLARSFLRVSKRSRENKIKGKLARATQDSRTFQFSRSTSLPAFRETLTVDVTCCDFIRESHYFHGKFCRHCDLPPDYSRELFANR